MHSRPKSIALEVQLESVRLIKLRYVGIMMVLAVTF
jgi:hypothetical protein